MAPNAPRLQNIRIWLRLEGVRQTKGSTNNIPKAPTTEL
jgi:hypothetical protein